MSVPLFAKMQNKVSQYNIHLSKDVSSYLKSFMSNVYNQFGKGKETEFEARFKIGDGMNESMFNRIKSVLEKDLYYSKKSNALSYIDILQDDIRRHRDNKGNVVKYEKKTELYKSFINIDKTTIKFSLSKEVPLDTRYTKSLFTRKRDRNTYSFKNLFNIDLSIIEISNDDNIDTKYELEVEFLSPEFIMDMKNVFLPIKYILNIIYPDKLSYADKKYEALVREEYVSLFNDKRQQYQKENFIFENKPINIKLEDIKTLNHSVTNKLNGVNFFLFYSALFEEIYLLNHSSFEILCSAKFQNDALIQGELYKENGKYTLYIFDVLFVDGKNITNKVHPDRCKLFEKYVNGFNNAIDNSNKKDLISLEFKKFYGILPSENNMYDNLINCKNSLKKDKNGEIDYEINDGFIFTPLNEPYRNKKTYKYKFPETMTIDFLVKLKSSDTENTKYFNLFVYNQNNEIVPFKTNDKKEYLMKCNKNDHPELYNEIKDDMIVECAFDSKNDYFYPYRIRFDKVKPNFYKVAEDTFSDIIYPITINDLEQEFLKIFKPSSSSYQKDMSHVYSKLSPSLQRTPRSPKKLSPEYKPEEQKQPYLFTPKSPLLPPGKEEYIDIPNGNLKVELNTLLEGVLFAVSPEYRDYDKENRYKMLIVAIEYIMYTLREEINIDNLAERFNVKIYELKETSSENKYKIHKSSLNQNNNIVYIVKKMEEEGVKYQVIGYTRNNREFYAF